MKSTVRSISLILAMVLLVSCLAVCVYAQDVIKSGIGFVTASALRMRSGPSLDNDTLDIAYNGDAVVVIGHEEGWYHVIFNLQEGYMCDSYLSVLDRENAELGYGKINSYCVNLRSGPSTDYETVDQAYEGERAYIIGINSGWYKVIFDNQICYVRSDLLDLTEIPYENQASSKSPRFFRGGFSIGPIPTGDALDEDVSTDSSSSESASDSYEEDTSDSYEDTSDSYEDSEEVSAEPSYISAGQEIVDQAEQFLGTSYVWGGSSPSGFDCSGYVQYVMRSLGYKVGRGTDAQYEAGEYVEKDDLVPGDMVFFAGTYDTTGTSHVGIYVGDGQFIHSSSAAGYVKYSDLNDAYYSAHYYGARRVF